MSEMPIVKENLDISPIDIRISPLYVTNTAFRESIDKVIAKVSRYYEVKETIRTLEITLRRISARATYQSDDVAVSKMGVPSGDLCCKDETFEDMSGAPMQEQSAGPPTQTGAFVDNPRSIRDYLDRPVLIGTLSWTDSAVVNGTFAVSSVFLGDPSVRAKLRNVAFLSGTWVIDVSCSGNDFMYGCAAVTPLIYPEQIKTLDALNSAEVIVAGIHELTAKFLMSVPGAQVLDCNKNSMLRFRIPFVSPMDMLRCYNQSTAALGTATDYSDALNMLTLRFATINMLGTTASTVSNASVAVYAHMEDVRLGLPTASVTAVTTQSEEIKEKEYDERISGPVEEVASRLAHLSSYFTSIPIIDRYAVASEMIFSTLSESAALLGWSVPIMNTAPHRVKNEPYQNEAHLVGYDTGKKLSVDPRQELTVSPEVVGVHEDQMSIAAIASKESLLYSHSWATTDTAISTPLFSIAVCPKAKTSVVSGTAVAVQPTWADAAVTPFLFWRGKGKYRIQVVCSPRHKGKLAVMYEPNVAQATLITGSLSLNKQCVAVIDLQETQDITFEIDWAAPRPWLVTPTDAAGANMCGNLSGLAASISEYVNGFFSVFPLTKLQSPNGNPCYINVWVAYPDLQVTYPSTYHIPTKRYVYQSDEKAVCDTLHIVLNPTGASNRDICQNTFGEQVFSFRSLLHRFETTYYSPQNADSNTLKTLTFEAPIIPPLPGYGSATTDVTLLTYLRYMFLAWHGGVRKRFRMAGLNPQAMENLIVKFSQVSQSSPTANVGFASGSPATNTFEGSLTFVPHTNGGIEFELPYYSNNKFGFTQGSDPYGPANAAATFMQTYALRGYKVQMDYMAATPNWMPVEQTAIGDDFSLLRLVAPAPFSLT